MSLTIRSRILSGRAQESPYIGAKQDFETATRRGLRLMCESCLHGSHSLCESEDCPCVCNDSDFRFARKAKAEALTSDPAVARVLVVRPELEHLFQ